MNEKDQHKVTRQFDWLKGEMEEFLQAPQSPVGANDKANLLLKLEEAKQLALKCEVKPTS